MTKPTFTSEALAQAADLLKCTVPHIQTVADVESAGGGFFPDGSPKTLFEGHIFHKYTAGKYAATHPTLCYRKWTREYYGRNWRQEVERREAAIELDRKAALLSMSWGAFQIMGFNYTLAGFKNVQSFVNAMFKDQDEHLLAFTHVMLEFGLDDELRNCDWARFARRYNGPGWQKNDYAGRLARAYSHYEAFA